MRSVLLGAAASLAAISVPAAAAEAQHWTDPGFVAAANVSVHRGSDNFPDFRSAPGSFDTRFCREFRRHHRDGDDDRDDGFRRRHRVFFDCGPFFGGSLGYLDYGDYDANRSFDPDKWNDWWHERPHRAFPRWVREQRGQNCDPERMWWSGSGWRC